MEAQKLHRTLQVGFGLPLPGLCFLYKPLASRLLPRHGLQVLRPLRSKLHRRRLPISTRTHKHSSTH